MAVATKQRDYRTEADLTPVNIDEEFVHLYRAMPTAWKNWSPTYSANNAMTWTTVTTNIARYCQIGNVVYFQIKATGTTGGIADVQLRFTLPTMPAKDTADYISGGCTIIDGAGVYRSGFFAHSGVSKTIAVCRYDFANFGLGTDRAVMVQGFYEID